MEIEIEGVLSIGKKLQEIIGEGHLRLSGTFYTKNGKINLTIPVKDEVSQQQLNSLIDSDLVLLINPTEVQYAVNPSTESYSTLFKQDVETEGLGAVAARIATIDPEKRTREVEAPKQLKPYINRVTEKIPQGQELPTESPVFTFEDIVKLAKESALKSFKYSDEEIMKEKDERKRFALLEKKELAESIEQSVYIVNRNYANVQLNSLGKTLPINMPLDLSKISAKKILNSQSELRGLLDNGIIEIITQEEANNIFNGVFSGLDNSEGDEEDILVDVSSVAQIKNSAGNLRTRKELRENDSDLDLLSGGDDTEESKLIQLTQIGQKNMSGPRNSANKNNVVQRRSFSNKR